MSQDCCRVCSRGLYSCHWKDSNRNRRTHAWSWFSVVSVVSLLSICWMYICLVTFNDREDVNWKGFKQLKRWVNWFMVLIIISAVLTSYCVLLLLFALFQVALGEKPDLHCLHKFFLVFGVLFFILGFVGISVQWDQEWPTVPLSLKATGPFLQFGAVGALTLLSSFVFHSFNVAQRGSKFLIAAVFVAVSTTIFLCPLFITSPCLITEDELPKKPKLIGHRGAPMLAPENTMMSFKRSIECGVTTFETDVQISKDRVPFLMHDHDAEFLLRTTNAKEKFPNTHFNKSTDLTIEELQSLNAGEWFLKTDPFNTVSQMTEEERETARNQTIPTLVQLLDLAKQHNISVLFDLYSPNPENDTVDIVDTILNSGINPGLVFWLPPEDRQYVNQTAPGFIHIYKKDKDEHKAEDVCKNGRKHINMKYNELEMEELRKCREKDISVNLWVVNERWLFSLLWCAGASSVTTNSCNLLKNVSHPDWVMSRRKYTIIWISVDIASVVIMIGLYILQWKTRCFCHRREIPRSNPAAWNEKELYPFLPTG